SGDVDKRSFFEKIVDFFKERFGFGVMFSPECGGTITESITLTEDFVCGAEFAITVGADDITINCNSNTILGPASGALEGTSVAIRNPGYNNLVIQNCVIQDYGESISVYSNSDNTQILNNNIYCSQNMRNLQQKGIRIIGSQNSNVDMNIISNCDLGILFFDSQGTITNNDISLPNVDAALEGINVGGSSGSSVQQNTITAELPADSSLLNGIHISYSNNNIISSNQISNVKIGVTSTGDSNQILGNEIEGILDESNSITGISSWGNNNIIQNNVISKERYGIRLNEGTQNQISSNTITSDPFFWDSEGIDISAGVSGNDFLDNNIITTSKGIFLRDNSNYNNLYGNYLPDNAEESAGCTGNNWNNSERGNYWTNAGNPGFPYNHTVEGEGDGVDYLPEWLEVECVIAENDCADGEYCFEGICTPCVDADGDTYFGTEGNCGEIDCDDTDLNIYPGAEEVCDGADNNCDGDVDEEPPALCDPSETCQGEQGCQSVYCGAWISHDTVLTENLTECSGTGLYIHGDDIMLDCAGHLIEGSGTNGIGTNSDNVTIKNCLIENFYFGIGFGSSDNIILNNTIIESTAPGSKGIAGWGSNNIIKMNKILDRSQGIFLGNGVSLNNNITENILIENNVGIFLDTDTNNNLFWANNLSNTLNIDSSSTTGNYWNLSTQGNYWSDFENNIGYPDNQYIIIGDGIDYHPKQLELETCSAQGGYECSANEFCPGSIIPSLDTDSCCDIPCEATCGSADGICPPGCSHSDGDPDCTWCGDGIVQAPNDDGENEECDDGNNLNGDGCDEFCQDEPEPECTTDEQCDDGSFCDGVETCQAGTCVAGTPPCVDDGVECTTVLCDEGSDQCNVPDDGYCQDILGLFCDGEETCDAVDDCQAGFLDWSDGVYCTVDSCDEDLDEIIHTANDVLCQDGLWCNGAEICDAVLGCQNGTQEVCDDGLECSVDSCDEGEDEGDDEGQCVSDTSDCTCTVETQEVDCDDGNLCTLDTCNPNTLLCNLPENVINGTECDDGFFCTLGDVCSGGVCSGDENECSDGFSCTVGTCDDVNDVCIQAGYDALCNDQTYCNGTEVCNITLGCVAGDPIVCGGDDGIECTDHICVEEIANCAHVENNTNCEDGFMCLVDEGGCVDTSGSFCGNNIAELGEECDGLDLSNETCESLGFPAGNSTSLGLICANCEFDTTDCVLLPLLPELLEGSSDFSNPIVEDAVLILESGKINLAGILNFTKLDLVNNMEVSQGRIGFDMTKPRMHQINAPADLGFVGVGELDEASVIRELDGGTLEVCEECGLVFDSETGEYSVGVFGFSTYVLGEKCGNSLCESGESCSTCPTDCGACDTGGGGGGGGGSPTVYECNDGLDNDLDGKIDYPDDLGCVSATDNTELDISELAGCVENWVCGDWSECENDVKTRDCYDTNNCGTFFYKPATEKECSLFDRDVIIGGIRLDLIFVVIVVIAAAIICAIGVVLLIRNKRLELASKNIVE
ncbi:MAG: right-handed parallel beta-helix repeat-containing protein, partial [Nanoarchaeota archaeon]|nr:right-handed parallel beta-helix repeat-containing protein [Nanoarchaeota archaeon]